MAVDAAMEIFEQTKAFPKEEVFSLTDQVRRSSRSVCANTAEGFRKRRYPKAMIARLSDAEAEAAETQVWLLFAHKCNYLDAKAFAKLKKEYDLIIGKLVRLIATSSQWKF